MEGTTIRTAMFDNSPPPHHLLYARFWLHTYSPFAPFLQSSTSIRHWEIWGFGHLQGLEVPWISMATLLWDGTKDMLPQFRRLCVETWAAQNPHWEPLRLHPTDVVVLNELGKGPGWEVTMQITSWWWLPDVGTQLLIDIFECWDSHLLQLTRKTLLFQGDLYWPTLQHPGLPFWTSAMSLSICHLPTCRDFGRTCMSPGKRMQSDWPCWPSMEVRLGAAGDGELTWTTHGLCFSVEFQPWGYVETVAVENN